MIEFVKLHGLGNDFVVIDDFNKTIDFTPEEVARICDRHKGVGADGVILVRPSDRPDCDGYMHYINSDGSLAQMCGNGVRCFAKFLVDSGRVPAENGHLIADTLAGPKPIMFEVDPHQHLSRATVDMGAPFLEPDVVPTLLKATNSTEDGTPFAADVPVASPWGEFRFTCVSMGNPHAVTFLDDFSSLPDEAFTDPNAKSLETMDVAKVGAFFESNPVFPEKSNIEFVSAQADGLHMRVYERGCAETLACGTGACAVNVAASLTGRAGRENDVILLGGTLHITWREDGHVMMTGAAEEAFRGTLSMTR